MGQIQTGPVVEHMQAGPLTDRAVHLLMSQPGFWRAIGDCFKAKQPARSTRSVEAAHENEAELWQLRTEAAALQLLVVQVHACSLPGNEPHTIPCQPCPSASASLCKIWTFWAKFKAHKKHPGHCGGLSCVFQSIGSQVSQSPPLSLQYKSAKEAHLRPCAGCHDLASNCQQPANPIWP